MGWREAVDDDTTPWFGYTSRFGVSFIKFKNDKKQRAVRCKECNVIIPKDVPRFYLYMSWSYSTGHYCLECGLKMLRATIQSRKADVEYLSRNLNNLETLKKQAERVVRSEGYKNKMAVSVMMTRLEGKRDSYY